ncbi:hypothetical protein GY45DRAFT_1438900 [Cubamyces sp. BRFM 1775]|nr:hypothetical protein GY45DRAFT_1438900 [Cubamyces sp. BRFM 1775]
MESNYEVISDPDPDLSPVAHPAPVPAVSSSSLLHALASETARLPPRINEERRKPPTPEPVYDPYPYPATWGLERAANCTECDFWNTRQDQWHLGLDGYRLHYVDSRNAYVIRRGIMERQYEAKRRHDRELFDARPPDKVKVESDSVWVVEFAMAEGGKKGLPAKMILSTRRAVERGMEDPKGKCFVGSPFGDKILVRLKWPAYPDHEVKKAVPVTILAGHKRPRRPVTRIELAVALTAMLTQYYSEVSALEPSPAFAHLALGQGEGRLSLYALRMIGIRLAPDGVFDLMLELDNGGEGNPAAANYERMQKPEEPVSSDVNLESLIPISRSPQLRSDGMLEDAEAGASGSHVPGFSASETAPEHAEASNASATDSPAPSSSAPGSSPPGSSVLSPSTSNHSASNPSAPNSSASGSPASSSSAPSSSATRSLSTAGDSSTAIPDPPSNHASPSSPPILENENTPEKSATPEEQD